MLAVAGVQIAVGAQAGRVRADLFFATLLAMSAVPYGFLVGLLRSRTAGLELENVRLDAALRARVEELRASRARIVERATPRAAGSSATSTTARSSDWSRWRSTTSWRAGNSTPTSRLPSCSTRASRS